MEIVLSYRPEDFLLFSEPVYWRLFLVHNDTFWPLQFGFLAGALAVALLVWRWPHRASGIPGLIAAVAWGFSGWAFFEESYASINWAAPYVAPLFYAEGIALLLLAGSRHLSFQPRPAAARSALGWTLLLYGLFIHPLQHLLADRPPLGFELFGLAPDPTAIATLGLLCLSAGGRMVLLAMVAPLLWCLASWITLDTLGTGEKWIPLAAIGIALAARPWRRSAG